MVMKEVSIKVDGSMPYARLCVYLWEESPELKQVKRPLLFMCPGGGYVFTSDREADPIAMRFLSKGYHAAILRYSVSPAEYPAALLEVAASMKLIWENRKEWHIDTERIVIQGCSAGGHLAASYGVSWHEDWLAKKAGMETKLIRPAGMILCYPVITSGEFAHRGSFEALLKNQYTEEMLKRTSIEKQITADTPETFLWHTYTDDCVPVENSLLFIQGMRKYDIPVEFHMYPLGGHGLATCDHVGVDRSGYGEQKECQSWIPLAETWLERVTQSRSTKRLAQ